MFRFEEYLQEFTSTVDFKEFIINMVIIAVLTAFLGYFYTLFGQSVSNRKKFSVNFIPLALTTMLIITIVKSSIALSLGLVGALSIVRFRAAIKDPEELTYLFITIGLGLAAGANQILIAVASFAFIILVLYFRTLVIGKKAFRSHENMYLNISSTNKDLSAITNILKEQFTLVELKRLDESEKSMELSFIVDARTIEEIEETKKKLVTFTPDITLSFVEQRSIAL